MSSGSCVLQVSVMEKKILTLSLASFCDTGCPSSESLRRAETWGAASVFWANYGSPTEQEGLTQNILWGPCRPRIMKVQDGGWSVEPSREYPG